MEKLDITSIPKNLKPNPLFKGISKELKNPKCFMPIERKLARIMYSDHKHDTIKAFTKCSRCQEKFNKKRAEIKKLGFSGVEQYQMWRKIMFIIHNKKDFVLG